MARALPLMTLVPANMALAATELGGVRKTSPARFSTGYGSPVNIA
jgi:hypothetical protein